MRGFHFSLSGEYVRSFLWLLVAIEPLYGELDGNIELLACMLVSYPTLGSRGFLLAF